MSKKSKQPKQDQPKQATSEEARPQTAEAGAGAAKQEGGAGAPAKELRLARPGDTPAASTPTGAAAAKPAGKTEQVEPGARAKAGEGDEKSQTETAGSSAATSEASAGSKPAEGAKPVDGAKRADQAKPAQGAKPTEGAKGAKPATDAKPTVGPKGIPVVPPPSTALPSFPTARVSEAKAASEEASKPAAAEGTQGVAPHRPVEVPESGSGGGFRALGILLVLGGGALMGGAVVSGEVAGLVAKLGFEPFMLVVAGLVLFGAGVVQRALSLHRQANKQMFEALAGANKRLRREFQEVREVSASLGLNVDVLQEKTESLVELASGHGFQSSIFSLAASLDHLGITVKERCDALDQSVAAETGKARETHEALAKKLAELEEQLASRQRDLTTALQGLSGRADAASGRIEERLQASSQEQGRQQSALLDCLAGLSEELQRSTGASADGLRAQIDEVGRLFEESRRESERHVSEALAKQESALRESLSGLSEALQRSTDAAAEELRVQIDEVGKAFDFGRRASERHLSEELERQQSALAETCSGLSGELDRAARASGQELRASVEELGRTLEEAHRAGEERVGSELVRHREALAARLDELSSALEGAARASAEAHAAQAQAHAEQGKAHAAQAEAHASQAKRLEASVATAREQHRELMSAVESAASRTDVTAAGERFEGELRGVEQRLGEVLDRSHAELAGLGREACETAREGTSGLGELGPRLERMLRERLDELAGEQSGLMAGTREAVEARVGQLEGWLAERHGSLQQALEARMTRLDESSDQVGERFERDLRAVEQRVSEDLERRQSVICGELAGLSLDVQEATRDAATKLEGLRTAVEGELGKKVSTLVEHLDQLEQQLAQDRHEHGAHDALDAELGQQLLAQLETVRGELAAAPEGSAPAELEPALERLGGRLEAALEARTEALLGSLVGELMAAAELNEERTLALINMLSGREIEWPGDSGAGQAGTRAPRSASQGAHDAPAASFGDGVEPAEHGEVPPALPGAPTGEEWAAESADTTERGQRWDGNDEPSW